jgi:ATP-dependent DNA ligase
VILRLRLGEERRRGTLPVEALSPSSNHWLPWTRSRSSKSRREIKNYRSADCVVGGFRYNEGKPVVGSLLLGLYDENGLLHHVGFTSTIRSEDKPALTARLKSLIAPPRFTGKAPSGPSRWSSKRSGEWQPLKAKLVVEVSYDDAQRNIACNDVASSRPRDGGLFRWA